MTIQEFIGDEVFYLSDNQIIYGRGVKTKTKRICDINKTYSHIQNLFKEKTEQESMKFQDDLGQFIADAINEKLKRK